MLGDLPGPVWFFVNSHAFTDIIFDFDSITIYIKGETF